MDIIYVIGTILSSIAAIFAWISKIRWSNEFREATQQIINSKDAEIENLKSHILRLEKFSPMILEKYYETNIRQMEGILSSVQEQLDTANCELSSSKDLIEEYTSQEEIYQDEIAKQSELIRIKEERIANLQQDSVDLSKILKEISHEREKEFQLYYKYDPELLFKQIGASSTDLGEVMNNDGSAEIVSKIDYLTYPDWSEFMESIKNNNLLSNDEKDEK
jgi:chromosome segregation ATPase